MKLGLFGGSFDPIHTGHLRALQAAALELSLDQILVIPNPFPPHKPAEHLSAYHHRREMVRLALRDYPNMELATIEEESEGPAYTIDTVRKVRSRLAISCEDCWLILGADVLLEFESWKEPENLFRDCQVAVLPRPGFELHRAPERFLAHARILHTPEIAISSTEIRRFVAAGESIGGLVPPAVEAYIQTHNLYRS
ncbi:MAG: nicotinate (nicotinamide) nucleotide adenylyltransferase [bacterium]